MVNQELSTEIFVGSHVTPASKFSAETQISQKEPKKVTSASERMLIVTRAMVTMRLKKEDSVPNCTLVRASTLHGDEELALATPGESYEDNGFLY